MTREVKIKINGVQAQSPEENDVIEVVSVGQMYEKDGFVCVTYDEVVEEEENGLVQVVKNLLKIRQDQVEVIKHGSTESHMVFVPERTTFTYYSTPLGELEVSVHTQDIVKEDLETGFRLRLQYELEMNQTFISGCSVDIEIEY